MIKKLENYGFKISESDILNLENNILMKLPKDYKDFLININGLLYYGYYNIALIDIFENNKFLGVECLYGFKVENETKDLIKKYNFLLNRFPKGFLAIGDFVCGDKVLLCCKEGINYGKVYFWDHENENPNEGEEPWMENMYLVANSFTEFMEKIHPDIE